MTSGTVINFPCGHSIDFEAVRGMKTIRCPTCAKAAEVKRGKVAGKPREYRAERNEAEYAGRVYSPAASDAVQSSGLAEGSRSLLKAIYREHPYVFDAAQRSGRLAVRP